MMILYALYAPSSKLVMMMAEFQNVLVESTCCIIISYYCNEWCQGDFLFLLVLFSHLLHYSHCFNLFVNTYFIYYYGTTTLSIIYNYYCCYCHHHHLLYNNKITHYYYLLLSFYLLFFFTFFRHGPDLSWSVNPKGITQFQALSYF